MKPLHVFNSLSRAVEEFSPLDPPRVNYYSCGPTVYLPQHLGNMRAYVFVDTLRRVLEFNGYQVRHVMNITDVGHMTSDADAGEDKIEKTARAEGKPPREVADFYIAQFKADCARLNIELPAAPLLCRATDHVGDMIALIQRIVKNDLAYVVRSGVYFDVEKWRGKHRAGRLSRQSLDEQHGQRLDHAADKKSPHDFALWVLNQPDHLMQWDSPWGRGYPGWHIECSAMSMKYLGETIDIHTGGLDHIPVHHENEIAQSEGATGHPFVRYFIHNAFLVGMEGAKISKSAGRFPVLDDLIAADIDPLAFRWLCLMAKYRSELIFTVDAVRAAQNSLLRLYNFIADMPETAKERPDADWVGEYVEQFGEALNDDLNTAQALAVVFEVLTAAHKMRDYNVCNAIRKFDSILGVDLENAQQKIAVLSESTKTQDVAAHLKARQRKQLRESKQYEKADALRQELLQSGYKVEDVRAAPGYRLKRLFVAGATP